MNRLIGLFIALGLGLWAQRMLTGPEPGFPRDALILFVVAGVLFVWNAQAPKRIRADGQGIGPRWSRRGLALSLAGLAVGLASLLLLWQNLQSTLGLVLWPLSVVIFVVGTLSLGSREAELGEPEQAPPPTEPADPPLNPSEPPDDRTISRSHHLKGAQSWARSHWDILLLLLILAVAAFVRFYQLDLYPNGCQSDECNNGLDALKWLSGVPYRPYAETNEGQATLFTYLVALSFKLFGVGVPQMRLVAALAGLLTVAAFFFLSRDLYGRKAALVATALLATARWHVTFSRIVYELILQPLVMIVLVFFLLRAIRSGKRWQWAMTGVALALGMNTYTAFRVIPFAIAAFLLYWLIRVAIVDRGSLRQDIEGVFAMAGGAFLAVLPLGVYTVQNWRVFTSRIQHISVMRDVERVGSNQPIVDNLRKTLNMFNWQGDAAALNNLPGAPMLDTLVAILFVLGVAYALWYTLRGRPLPVLYTIWFVSLASLAVLSVAHEAPTARRTIGLIPLIYLLVALVADQFFLAWHTAWRGKGDRVFALVAAAAVALTAFGNVRTYFRVQAPDPSVWSAYSPNESAVGEYLATLPVDATVLITPLFEHHSSIKLMGRGHPYRALNPVDDLPYRDAASGDLVYVLEPVDRPLLGLLQQIYPAGQAEEHLDRFGQELFLSYTVPQANLAASQGLVGQFFSSYPPVQAPEATQAIDSLDLDMAQAPLAAPYFAIYEGTLLVPRYGQYVFTLDAEGEAASLQVGSEQRLNLSDSDRGQVQVTLAEGFHPVRVEFRSGPQPGKLKLSWSGPEVSEQTVGGDVLYSFRLGDRGLVGSYYPNGNWEGSPALVRNDLLITPNNPLREPFSILWRGKIAIPESGVYTFGTRSDDGSYVYINGELVVDNGGSHGAEDRSGTIQLDQGFHDIEVRYSELGGSREMQLWWQPPNQGRAVVDTAYLFPLEGDALPAGLAMPPPPQIAQAEPAPEPGLDDAPPDRSGPQEDLPPVQSSGDFALLQAEVLWQVGSCGVGDDQLNAPRGVAIDSMTGDVLVADTGNQRIVRLDAQGQVISAWGQSGESPDQFQEPVDLVVEPAGTVLVLDAVNQRLLRFSPDGQFQSTFGADLTFYRPRGLGIDAAGQLAIADTGGVRIMRLGPDGALQSQVGGPESDVAAMQPTDAALTPGGDLFFVEAESGAISRLGADGSFSRWSGTIPASTIDGPHLALRPGGGLYVSDPEGRRVLVFDAGGKPLGQFGGEFGLVKPAGLAAVQDSDGDTVIVADSAGCQVLAFRVQLP